MIPAILAAFLLLNAAALVAIAAWYRRDRGQLLTDKREWRGVATDAIAERDDLAAVLAAKDDAHAAERAEAEAELAAERSGWLQTLRTNIATAEKAMDDVAWAQGVLATCQLELDQRDRHTLLLTLDGIRADTEDGIRYEGDEPPISAEVRTNVTPIKRRAGK